MTGYLRIVLKVEVQYQFSSHMYAGLCRRRGYLRKEVEGASYSKDPKTRSTEQCFLSSFQSTIVLVRGKELWLLDLYSGTCHLVLKDSHTNFLR